MSESTKKNRPKNALTHGAYAIETILPEEDVTEFLKLRQACRDAFNPTGLFQEEIVNDITHKSWVKRRIRAAIEEASHKRAQPGPKRHLMTTAQLCAAFEEDEPYEGGPDEDEPDEDEPDEDERFDPELAPHDAPGEYGPAVRKLLEASEIEDPPFDLAALERLLKIDASLDARIEKDITRLAGVKEYAQRYGMRPLLETDAQY